MHEIGLLEEMLEMVVHEAALTHSSRVHRVKLKVGRMSGAVPEALYFAFDAIKQGTILSEASLEIEEVPVVCRCHDCGGEFQPESPIHLCPHCESLDAVLLQGDELVLESVEMSQ